MGKKVEEQKHRTLGEDREWKSEVEKDNEREKSLQERQKKKERRW